MNKTRFDIQFYYIFEFEGQPYILKGKNLLRIPAKSRRTKVVITDFSMLPNYSVDSFLVNFNNCNPQFFADNGITLEFGSFEYNTFMQYLTSAKPDVSKTYLRIAGFDVPCELPIVKLDSVRFSKNWV